MIAPTDLLMSMKTDCEAGLIMKKNIISVLMIIALASVALFGLYIAWLDFAESSLGLAGMMLFMSAFVSSLLAFEVKTFHRHLRKS